MLAQANLQSSAKLLSEQRNVEDVSNDNLVTMKQSVSYVLIRFGELSSVLVYDL